MAMTTRDDENDSASPENHERTKKLQIHQWRQISKSKCPIELRVVNHFATKSAARTIAHRLRHEKRFIVKKAATEPGMEL
jgi:hypothetical protein